MPNSDRVKRWRKKTKQRMVDSMGGECVCCSYNKCNDALDLHHLIPEEKEFGVAKVMAHPISWKRIVVELKKCVLVCNRCHKEVHNGITKIPTDAKRFNDEYTNYKEKETKDKCPICGELKSKHNITCSLECAAKKSSKVDWDSIDLEVLIKTVSVVKIAKDLNVSDSSVHKRLKKLGLK